MYDHLIRLIKDHFGISIHTAEKISDHGAKVYLLKSTTEKYALKEMGPDDKLDNEGELTEYLIGKGASVAIIQKAKASGSSPFRLKKRLSMLKDQCLLV